MGPELKRASVLNNPVQHHVRSAKALELIRPRSLADAGVRLQFHALDPAAVIALQRAAGNRAVSALLAPVQRGGGKPTPAPKPKDFGWTDAEKTEKGHKWNVDAQDVGEIHRIPLEGLTTVGFQDRAKSSLTKESAGGKAIVLVPKSTSTALKAADAKLDVVVFLHGFTENSNDRPFAGYRALTEDPAINPNVPQVEKRKTARTRDEEFYRSLRQGIDTDDVMPARDVALDDAEGQLQASGNPLTIMVLPQGGLTSEFGTAGGREFNADAYVNEIISRVVNKRDFLVTDKKPEEIGRRITMAGHSGAGISLAQMARRSTRMAAERKKAAAAKPAAGDKAAAVDKSAKPEDLPKSSELTGDLVLFDAINESDVGAFAEWAKMRLDADLVALKGFTGALAEAQRREHLKKSQKLRGYYSTGWKGNTYVNQYTELQTKIDQWFRDHMAELEPLGVAGCLHANYFVMTHVAVSHEELMRGTKAGEPREGAGPKGGDAGTILDALKALNPDYTSCPPLGELIKPKEKKEAKPKAEHAGAVEEEEPALRE